MFHPKPISVGKDGRRDHVIECERWQAAVRLGGLLLSESHPFWQNDHEDVDWALNSLTPSMACHA